MPELGDDSPVRLVALRLVVEGKVQKVGFREWMRKTAQQLRLQGWVRNRFNGTVEAFLVGEEDTVKTMVQKTHVGPPAAAVRRVKLFPQKDTKTAKGFQILP